ncbi:MAG: pyridoxamine 5'-phosphate oxidase [Acidimicrobiia bacterium]|nr:pyridoxamine 5'-phosphate oxidase [Acidimicrobiia bacterium]
MPPGAPVGREPVAPGPPVPAGRDGAHLRRGLFEADVDPDPMVQVARWMDEAVAAGVPQPDAMTVATATAEGRPSARMVLLRGIDAGGFAFYTNFESRKGRELAANPWVAVVVYWHDLHRQVRAEGRARPMAPEESEPYWRTRPLRSRLGAWASPQSEVLGGRADLEARLAEVERRFGLEGADLEADAADVEVPLPEHWGGFRVEPEVVELWQQRPDRLHDRLRYRRSGDGWVLERLAP